MTAIVYKIGDLLASTQKVIAHGCNSHGVMGSGVAWQIKKKYPNVFEVYALRHKVFGLNLGDIVPVATVDGRIVVNCITQENFGRNSTRYVDYDAIAQCIEKMDRHVKDWEVNEIAFPRIGAGLGGGDWNVIEEIIVKTARNFVPVVYDFDGKV